MALLRRISPVFVAVVALGLLLSARAAASDGPPAAPTNFRWEGGLHEPLQLWWDDNSNNEDGFRLKQLVGGEWVEVATYPANSTGGPTPGFSFEEWCHGITLVLVAYNESGESAPSNEFHLPPPPSGCRDTLRETYVNDAGGRAVELQLRYEHGLEAARLVANAPGCPDPVVSLSGVRWPVPCVDPGESVTLELDVIGPIVRGEPVWVTPVPGDANCDGALESVDALFILRDVAGLGSLSACGRYVGDTDLDGDIDASDAQRVLATVAGLVVAQ